MGGLQRMLWCRRRAVPWAVLVRLAVVAAAADDHGPSAVASGGTAASTDALAAAANKAEGEGHGAFGGDQWCPGDVSAVAERHARARACAWARQGLAGGGVTDAPPFPHTRICTRGAPVWMRGRQRAKAAARLIGNMPLPRCRRVPW